jgi:hypothetical protein
MSMQKRGDEIENSKMLKDALRDSRMHTLEPVIRDTTIFHSKLTYSKCSPLVFQGCISFLRENAKFHITRDKYVFPIVINCILLIKLIFAHFVDSLYHIIEGSIYPFRDAAYFRE